VYNPAVTVHNGRLWMVARHEGRNRTGAWTTCPDHSLATTRACPVPTLRMVSFVVRCQLDASLRPITPLEGLDYDLHWDHVGKTAHDRQLGPEDPRVFAWGAEQYVAVNGPPLRPLASSRTIRNMKIQKIFPAVGEPVDLDLGAGMERYEKNWAPIQADPASPRRRFLFARNVEPHQIVGCDAAGKCLEAAASSQAAFFAAWKRLWQLRALHLGTNAIKLRSSNKYAAILHGILASSSRTYLNFVYVFEAAPPWQIVGVGAEPLQLPLGSVGSGFAFTTNLAWVGDKIVVSYCVKDRTSSFFIANATTLLSNLQAV